MEPAQLCAIVMNVASTGRMILWYLQNLKKSHGEYDDFMEDRLLWDIARTSTRFLVAFIEQIFCHSCIVTSLRNNTWTCPYCRAYLPSEGIPATDIAKKMKSVYQNCTECDTQISVSERAHLRFMERFYTYCPICRLIPGGDPSYFSRNFIRHLQLRHTFNHEDYIDINIVEEALIENILYQSFLEYMQVNHPNST
nr:E3 ubiquitin-protein ligase RNF125 [Chrysemys picta bellii]